MTESPLNILVVCMANYCRSPVAEFLLKEKYFDRLNIDSAGLIDFPEFGMDSRSIKFLKSIGKTAPVHQPKKITKKLLERTDIIYAIDHRILISLNKEFPAYKEKFELFAIKNKRIFLPDPYTLSKEEYISVMKRIEYISENISINI
ncbi:MAG: low molecular weight phosphatase family protein [Hellea sp.]|nr:low molecular weight phosphatase family protein [Hellea sp.]